MSTSIEDLLNSVDSDEDISLGGNEELDLEALLKGDDDDDDEPLSATTISILKTTKSLMSAGQSPSVGNSAVDLTAIYASANLTKKTEADARQGSSPVPRDSDSDPLGDILRDVDAAGAGAAPSIDLRALQRDRLGNLSSHDQLSAMASTPAGGAEDSALDSDSVALLQAELREQRALNVPDKIGLSALQIRRANSAGVISNMTSVEEVGEITKQLLRNGSYEMHGPGTATTMAICNKFVAVGTVKGFVILFDHKQEIRRVLSFQQALQSSAASTLSSAASLATGAGPAAAKVTGPAMAVTSLDCLSDGSGLLAAHRSGDIFFWDTVRGTIVRQLRDPHGADIVGIGFLPSISLRETRINGPIGESDGYQFVTWSANHVINRFRLARSLLTTWHVDADCLLDDRSGPVVSMSICKPCPVADAADTDGDSGGAARVRVAQRDYVDVKQQPVAFQFFAFGFAHQTCVVQVQPDVRIVYKWKTNSAASAVQAAAPAAAPAAAGAATDAATPAAPAAAKELLDWSWLPLPIAPPDAAAATASGSAVPSDVPPELAAAAAPGDDAPKPPVRLVPALTRCRGRFIEVLAMRAYRPVAPPAAATPTPSSPAAGAASDAPAATAAASMATALRRSSLQLFGGFMSGVSATAAAVGAGSGASGGGGSAADDAGAAAPVAFDFAVVASTFVRFSDDEALGRLAQSKASAAASAAAEGDAFGVVELKWINASQLIALTPREALLFDLNLVCLERVPLPRALCDAAVATGGATAALVSRAYSQQLYVLQATSLHRVVVKSALDQVNALVASGRWLEGLARLVDAVAKSPPLLQTEAEHIRRFIHNYALLAVKRTAADPFAAQRRASAASFGGAGGGGGGGGVGGSDHFQLVASVCVEYCVATRQLDVLCGEVLEIFRSEAQQAALLEALEPWIVAGSIRALPPRVVAEFLECAVAADRLRTVERCVPHFDPHALDLDFVARFLFAHRMLSPFLYVVAYGVGDVAAAFLTVVEHVAAQQLAPPPPTTPGSATSGGGGGALLAAGFRPLGDGGGDGGGDAEAQWLCFVSAQAEAAYKLLLFAWYVFRGRVFPRGTEAAYSIAAVWALLAALVAPTWDAPAPLFGPPPPTPPLLRQSYPTLRLLAAVDRGAVFFVLRAGLARLADIVAAVAAQTTLAPAAEADADADAAARDDDAASDGDGDGDSDGDEAAARPTADAKTLHVLLHVFRFCRTVDAEQRARDAAAGAAAADDDAAQSPAASDDDSDGDGDDNARRWTRRAAAGDEAVGGCERDFFDRFAATLCALRAAALPLGDLLPRLLRYARDRGVAEHAAFETRFEALATRQTRFYRRQSATADERLAALQALHDALARGGFHLAALRVRAAAALPQLSVAAAAGGEAAAVAAVVAPVRQYLAACAFVERGDAAHSLAFRFLDALLAQQAAAAAQHATVAAYAAAYAASLAAVRRVLGELCRVDVARTARLVVAHLLPQFSDIVAEGDAAAAPGGDEAQALRLSFLLTVLRDFAATAPGADVVSAGYLRERDLLVLVRLLAAHQPDALVGFLREHREHCPLDDCLEAARAGGVYDAVAFLLERAGDVSGALTVLLQDVSLRARQARRDVDTQLRQDAQAAAPSPLPGAGRRASSAAAAGAAAATTTATVAAGDVVARLPVGRRLRALVDYVAQLCERAEEHDALRAQALPRDAAGGPSGGPSGPGGSEELWFRALDHLLAERHLLRGGTISSASEAVAQCLSQLLQSFLARLLSSGRVSPTAVLTRIVSHASAAGLRLSECRDIVLAMLRGQEHDAQQRGLVCGVLRHDVHVLARHRQAQHKRARVCRSDAAIASAATVASSSSSSSSVPTDAAAAPEPQRSPAAQRLHATLLAAAPAAAADASTEALPPLLRRRQTEAVRYGGGAPRWKIRELRDVRSMQARARGLLASMEPATGFRPPFEGVASVS